MSETLTDKNQYYSWQRADAIKLLQSYIEKHDTFHHILEIGCGSGETAAALMKLLKPKSYTGIEINPEAARKAKTHICNVIQGDFNQMITENKLHGMKDKSFDLIVLLDILEHLIDPWEAAKTLSELLSDDGLILCSIPNAGNYYVIKRLIKDKLVYEERGLLDKTHLHFFTLYTIKELFREKGLKIVATDTNTDLFIPKIKLFNFLTFGLLKKLFIRQYLLIVRKNHVR